MASLRVRRALWRVLQFEVLWKALVLMFISPLMDQIYQTYVSSVGISFNGNLLGTFLNLKGGLIFLALFLMAGALAFYELSVVIALVSLCREGRQAPLRLVMRDSLWTLGALRGWSIVPVSLYYLLLLPLLQVGYFHSLVPELTIPWFVMGEMQKSAIGRVGMVALYVLYLGLGLVLVFVPVRMALRRERFFAAARGSLCSWRRLGAARATLLLAVLVLWVLAESELARYWRRNTLENADFDRYFLKNLVYSEAFRIDLAYWLVMAALYAAAMAAFVYLLLARVLDREALRAPFPAPWSEDSRTLLAIWGRRWSRFRDGWRQRWAKRRWRAAAGAVCLLLVGYLAVNCWQPPLVHAPLVIGHRGSIYGIENTLEAVSAASAWGADYAEVDIQLSADGVPVAVHDGNLWRLAGEAVNVFDLTWAELQALTLRADANPGQTGRIPSLEELLELVRDDPNGMGLLIELKPEAGGGEALAEAVTGLVERYDLGERVMFMSLDYDCLLPIQSAHPEWWVGYCAYASAGDLDEQIWQYNIDFLAVEENLVSNQLATQARELNLPVYVWTVYDTDKMEQYLQMGITGLISDWPDLAEAVRERYCRSHTVTYQWTGEGFPRGTSAV